MAGLPCRGITESRGREVERRRGILGDAIAKKHTDGPRGRGVPRHESVYHRDPHRAPAAPARTCSPTSSGTGPGGCWPRPSRPRSPPGSTTTPTSRTTPGRRQVVRNGHLPERTIQTGIGAVEVQQPRVRDRRPADQREAFTSAILPPYLRKTRSLEELIPWLYLKGVSTGDFSEALQAILGPDAPGLSATTVTRLKAAWEDEYEAWSKRSLAGKHYVYVWADGVHFNIRLEGGRQCILVLMGATAEGKKELIAIADGYRESEQSWKELLLDVKARGLEIEPRLAIGDGALGFWKAMRQVWDTTKEQRCWVHKTANVLDKLPKGAQPKAKADAARDLRGRDRRPRRRRRSTCS